MNLRISLTLVIVAVWIAVGSVFVLESGTGEAEERVNLPFFYTLEPDDIRVIDIETTNGATEFVLRPGERIWYFAELQDTPVSHARFGGMAFLLGGPKIKRILNVDVIDDSQFGLDAPSLVVDLTLRDGSSVAMELGNLTPDGEGQYSRIIGFPEMVLVDSSWGGVISRLVAEPPYPAWRYEMDPSRVKEVLFFDGNEVVRGLAFHDDQGWIECDIPVQNEIPCIGNTPLNPDGVDEWLQHLASPAFRGVAQVSRTAQEATPELFGITPESPYMDIRIEAPQRQGVIEVTHVTLAIGHENPDGQGLYVRAMEQYDIAEVNIEWGRKTLAFFDDRSFVDQ
jgi:hypothetical protein